MLEFPAHNGGDPVGCHNCLLLGVQSQQYGDGGELSKALAVSLVMHELARLLIILNHSVSLELKYLNSLIQCRLTPAFTIKPSSTMFWFSFYPVIAFTILFKVRSGIVVLIFIELMQFDL